MGIVIGKLRLAIVSVQFELLYGWRRRQEERVDNKMQKGDIDRVIVRLKEIYTTQYN